MLQTDIHIYSVIQSYRISDPNDYFGLENPPGSKKITANPNLIFEAYEMQSIATGYIQVLMQIC